MEAALSGAVAGADLAQIRCAEQLVDEELWVQSCYPPGSHLGMLPVPGAASWTDQP